MNEANLSKCKVCNQLKNRIADGNFNHRDKRWRDESGGMWSGRTCPSCHRERIARLKREKLQKKVE